MLSVPQAGDDVAAWRSIRLSGEPVAVGGRGAQMRLLVRSPEGRFLLAGVNRRGRVAFRVEVDALDEPIVPGAAAPVPGLIDTGRKAPRHFGFVDPIGRLFVLDETPRGFALSQVAGSVLLAGREPRRVWFLERPSDEGPVVVNRSHRHTPSISLEGVTAARPAAVLLPACDNLQSVFVAERSGEWQPWSPFPSTPVKAAPTAEVVGGLIFYPGYDSTRRRSVLEWGLLILVEDRSELRLAMPGREARSCALEGRAKRVALSSERSPRILVELEGGAFEVRELPGFELCAKGAA
jgi:hypothetical protein